MMKWCYEVCRINSFQQQSCLHIFRESRCEKLLKFINIHSCYCTFNGPSFDFCRCNMSQNISFTKTATAKSVILTLFESVSTLDSNPVAMFDSLSISYLYQLVSREVMLRDSVVSCNVLSGKQLKYTITSAVFEKK